MLFVVVVRGKLECKDGGGSWTVVADSVVGAKLSENNVLVLFVLFVLSLLKLLS